VAKYPCRCHQVRASLTTFPPTSNLNKSPRNNTRPRSSYKLINKLSLNCYTNFHFTFINYNGFANLNALEESEFRCSLISAKGAQRHRHLYVSWSSRTVSLRRWWLSTAISEWGVIVRRVALKPWQTRPFSAHQRYGQKSSIRSFFSRR